MNAGNQKLLDLEILETREVPTASILPVVEYGGVTYQVRGTESGDLIRVSQVSSNQFLNVAQMTVSDRLTGRVLASHRAVTLAGTTVRLHIDARGQDDRVENNTPMAATLHGGEGDDHLQGGPGADILHGGAGRDVLAGGTGDDRLHGGDHMDFLWGGAVGEYARPLGQIAPSTGNDWLYGGNGDDFLIGGDGNDFLFGEGHNDVLFGCAGGDLLSGGEGNDVLDPGYASGHVASRSGDELIGGTGRDIFLLSYVAGQTPQTVGALPRDLRTSEGDVRIFALDLRFAVAW